MVCLRERHLPKLFVPLLIGLRTLSKSASQFPANKKAVKITASGCWAKHEWKVIKTYSRKEFKRQSVTINEMSSSDLEMNDCNFIVITPSFESLTSDLQLLLDSGERDVVHASAIATFSAESIKSTRIGEFGDKSFIPTHSKQTLLFYSVTFTIVFIITSTLLWYCPSIVFLFLSHCLHFIFSSIFMCSITCAPLIPTCSQRIMWP